MISRGPSSAPIRTWNTLSWQTVSIRAGEACQRYIIVRVFQAIIALLAVSVIVFFLTRITGNPMDVLMPQEVMQEDFDRIRKAWGLDRPMHIQYLTFVGNALKGEFGESWKWPGKHGNAVDNWPVPCHPETSGCVLGCICPHFRPPWGALGG